MAFEFENEYLRYAIDSDGRNLHFVDKESGHNYAVPQSACAQITKAGQVYEATSVSRLGEQLQVVFGAAEIVAIIHVTTHDHHFVLEVESVSDPQVEELVFAHVPLTLAGDSQEAFAGCALALNLQTDVDELPGANSLLRAVCCQRFGFSGARAALIGCQEPGPRPRARQPL